MESNSVMLPTPDSMTPSEISSVTSDDFFTSRGLVVKYDTIEYRGERVTFLSDPSGNQCVAKWGDEIIDLGLNNIHYKEDMCRTIDRRLDLITEFRDSPDLAGAKLEWFHNGDYRDIRLSYKGRILKIFLVADPSDPLHETSLISAARSILYNSRLLDTDK